MPTRLILCLFAVIALANGYLLYRMLTRRRYDTQFPTVPKDQIIYEEFFASGNAQDDSIQRTFGGARNSLHVIVTASELIIRPTFTFGLASLLLDIKHYIPKKYILSLTRKSSFPDDGLLIEYRMEDGTRRSFYLRPQDYTALRKAINTGMIPAQR